MDVEVFNSTLSNELGHAGLTAETKKFFLAKFAKKAGVLRIRSFAQVAWFAAREASKVCNFVKKQT